MTSSKPQHDASRDKPDEGWQQIEKPVGKASSVSAPVGEPGTHTHTPRLGTDACACGARRVMVPCPDGKPGCAVAHWLWTDATDTPLAAPAEPSDATTAKWLCMSPEQLHAVRSAATPSPASPRSEEVSDAVGESVTALFHAQRHYDRGDYQLAANVAMAHLHTSAALPAPARASETERERAMGGLTVKRTVWLVVYTRTSDVTLREMYGSEEEANGRAAELLPTCREVFVGAMAEVT